MTRLLRLFLFAVLSATAVVAQRDIGRVDVLVDKNTLPVRVSANTPELNTLALLAFNSHGRYKLVASGFTFDIKFSAMSANQVRVDISRAPSGTAVSSDIASGSTARNALLRAADIAVAKTNGMGLGGFFAAKLAFVAEATGKKEVYVSDLFLGEMKRLTSDRAPVLMPRWAPDGTRLLYTSYFKSGFPDVYQHDLNTYQRTEFARFRGTNMGARFSPNGRQVAMVLTGEGQPEIYVSDAQGRQVARKTRSDAVKSSPCWSPDGSQLVFAMEPGPQLYVMSAAGGAPRKLPVGFTYSAEPDWSRAKPNKIACTVRVPGGKYQIAVYDSSIGKTEVVSKAAFDGIEPSWLADGRHLVYTARSRSTSVVCILDTETGKSTPITPASFIGAQQASVWNP
ncbi:MAG: biopolymer transporter Tol [Opitutaceae bacterium]|nr:biopolymer transporter Tol [Opitutaceae bacterium]